MNEGVVVEAFDATIGDLMARCWDCGWHSFPVPLGEYRESVVQWADLHRAACPVNAPRKAPPVGPQGANQS